MLYVYTGAQVHSSFTLHQMRVRKSRDLRPHSFVALIDRGQVRNLRIPWYRKDTLELALLTYLLGKAFWIARKERLSLSSFRSTSPSAVIVSATSYSSPAAAPCRVRAAVLPASFARLLSCFICRLQRSCLRTTPCAPSPSSCPNYCN